MNNPALIAVIAFLITLPILVAVYYKLKSKRRQEMLQSEFSSEWSDYLIKRVPIYVKLPDYLKEQLHGLINVFIDEIEFVGCSGLEITDEIKVTVAGQACILLLNRETSFYNGLNTVYIYPHTYVKGNKSSRDGKVISEQTIACEGEAWQHGPIVLTWDNIVHGASDIRDGHNVVFHEFAHKLDQESGRGNGTPILEQSTQYLAWGRILGEEYKELCDKTKQRKESVMDAYGATNEAEFFAVATETFFEKPRQLFVQHEELYEVLKDYYKLDPLMW